MDQSEVDERADSLIFNSKVLDQDLILVGKVSADLVVSSSSNDTDFHVSLNDVTPDGKSMLVRYGIQIIYLSQMCLTIGMSRHGVTTA